MVGQQYDAERAKAAATLLGIWIDRIANQSNCHTIYNNQRDTIENAIGDHALPMTWDFPEPNILGKYSGSALGQLFWIQKFIEKESGNHTSVEVFRGSAVDIPYHEESFDAIITDPPYYDNISYAALCGGKGVNP